MIFKRRSKLFWVEAFVYAVIIAVCVLGSYGVFDAKATEPVPSVEPVVEEPLAVGTCETWIELPATLRIRILQFGMINELMATDIGSGKESLISCLSERTNMKLLDDYIVAECRSAGEENLGRVFDRSLERIVFRCLKWVNSGNLDHQENLKKAEDSVE